MPHLKLSLFYDTLRAGENRQLTTSHSVVWLLSGQISWNDHELSSETGHLLQGPGTLSACAEDTELVRFTVGRTPEDPEETSRILQSETVRMPGPDILLRLDKISFPPGASAWRHVHPGPGFRYLIHGKLRLEADAHTASMEVGDSWFEDAHSPVKATACSQFTKTAFIRLLLLPLEFKGKPTIRILSDEDRQRERRQTTTTYFDVPVKV